MTDQNCTKSKTDPKPCLHCIGAVFDPLPVTRTDFVIQRQQLLQLTSQFKAINDYRQRKFSELVNQNKHDRKGGPETGRANCFLRRVVLQNGAEGAAARNQSLK